MRTLKSHTKNAYRAFTLAEMLLVIGLLSILTGVGTVAASRMMRNGRQTALDTLAQTLYTAVQRNLTAAKLSGANARDFKNAPTGKNVALLYLAEGTGKELDTEIYQLWAGENAALEEELFQGVSTELKQAHWILFYDVANWTIHDVYFSQKDGGRQDDYFTGLAEQSGADVLEKLTSLRDVSTRLADDAMIGYYGSDSISMAAVPPDVDEIVDLTTPPPGVESGTGGGSPQDPTADLIPDGQPLVNPDTGETILTDNGDTITVHPGEPVPVIDPDTGDTASYPDGTPITTTDPPKMPTQNPDHKPPNSPDDTVTALTKDNDQTKTRNVSQKLTYWIGYGSDSSEPILNAETLVTYLNCWVPNTSAFNKSGVPADVIFKLRVTGVSSGAIRNFSVKMSPFGAYIAQSPHKNFVVDALQPQQGIRGAADEDGQETHVSGWYYRYPIILDSLTQSGSARLDSDQPFRVRFQNSENQYAFIPGEDIMLKFEVTLADSEVKKAAKSASFDAVMDEYADKPGQLKADYGGAFTAALKAQIIADPRYDWLWKVHRPGWNEYPICNSLYADSGTTVDGEYNSPVTGDGVYTAAIKCGRHLQNLDARISGIGTNLDNIRSYERTEQGAETIRAIQETDIDFNGGQDARQYERWNNQGRTFTPITNPYLSEYDGGGYKIANLRVNLTDQSGIDSDDATRIKYGAGLFGALSGSVTLDRLKLENPMILGAGTAVGGVVGRADSLTLSAVRLYMSEESYQNKTLDDVQNQWLTGGRYAGGLVGYADGDVTINGGSFAATVVNASAGGTAAEPTYAGGLTGYVAGKLTVNSAWADCYVRANAADDATGAAAYLGGLAGYCGPESSFTRCYAAGFAVSNARDKTKLTRLQPIAAAGFVPANVERIENAYSIFNLDDPTVSPVNGQPRELTLAAKYALAKQVTSASNAYYTYRTDIGASGNGLSAQSRESLKSLSIDGFTRKTDADCTTLYKLSNLTVAEYPYPMLDGQERHYNDYFVNAALERKSVTIRPTLSRADLHALQEEIRSIQEDTSLDRDAQNAASAEVYDRYLVHSAYAPPDKTTIAATDSGQAYVKTATESRRVNGERFLGWFTLEQLTAYQQYLTGLSAWTPSYVQYLDGAGVGNADKSHSAYLFANDARLLVSSTDYNASVSGQFIALYERAEPFYVTFEQRYYNESRMQEALDALKRTLPEGTDLERVLKGETPVSTDEWDNSLQELLRRAFQGAYLSPPDFIAVDPTDPVYDASVKKSYTFDREADANKSADIRIPAAKYCARFDSDGGFIEFCPVASDSAERAKISIQEDKPSVYIALYDNIPVPLTVTLTFGNTDQNADLANHAPDTGGVWDKAQDLNQALAAARTVSNQECSASVTVYGSLDAAMMDAIQFEGFTLDDERTENNVVLVNQPNETRLYYNRNRRRLSYDFDGGLYYDADGKKYSFRESETVYYGADIYADCLPNGDSGAGKDANTVSREDYDFVGWEFYGADKDNASLLGKLPMIPVFHTDAAGYLRTPDNTSYAEVAVTRNSNPAVNYRVKLVENDTKFRLCHPETGQELTDLNGNTLTYPLTETGTKSEFTPATTKYTLTRGGSSQEIAFNDSGLALDADGNVISVSVTVNYNGKAPEQTFLCNITKNGSHYYYVYAIGSDEDKPHYERVFDWFSFRYAYDETGHKAGDRLYTCYENRWGIDATILYDGAFVSPTTRPEQTLTIQLPDTPFTDAQYVERTYGYLQDNDGALLSALDDVGPRIQWAESVAANAEASDRLNAAGIDLTGTVTQGQLAALFNAGWNERDFDKLNVQKQVRDCDGNAAWIETTLDKALVGVSASGYCQPVKMPNFDTLAKAAWAFKSELSVRMERYIQRESDGCLMNTDAPHNQDRNRVYFSNIRCGDGDALSDACFYGDAITRLPAVEEAQDKYRPLSYGDEYEFKGWYTAPNGAGQKIELPMEHSALITIPEPVSGQVDEWREALDGYSALAYETDRPSREGAVGQPYKMDAAPLTLFACWAPRELELQLDANFPEGVPDTLNVKPLTVTTGEPVGEKLPINPGVTFVDAPVNIDDAILTALERESGKRVEKRVTYQWDGWYTFHPPQEDEDAYRNPTAENLLKYGVRVSENDVFVSPATLYGRWIPVAGPTDYYVACYLEGGEVVKIRKYGLINDAVLILPPRPEDAETDVSAENADAYRKLSGYYPVSDLISRKIFPAYEFQFRYLKGEPWTYSVRDTVEIGGITLRTRDKSAVTMAKTVYLDAPLNGYELLNATKTDMETATILTTTIQGDERTFDLLDPVVTWQETSELDLSVPVRLDYRAPTETELERTRRVDEEPATVTVKTRRTEYGTTIEFRYRFREGIPTLADVGRMKGTDYLAPLRRGSGTLDLLAGYDAENPTDSYFMRLTLEYKNTERAYTVTQEGAYNDDTGVCTTGAARLDSDRIPPGTYQVTAKVELCRKISTDVVTTWTAPEAATVTVVE